LVLNYKKDIHRQVSLSLLACRMAMKHHLWKQRKKNVSRGLMQQIT